MKRLPAWIQGVFYYMSYKFKPQKRVEVFNKYNGKCAYCGTELDISKMQVDHINPIYRGSTDTDLKRYGVIRGTNELENLNPSCKSCNASKSTYTLEAWRKEISLKTSRLKRDSSTFRILLRYGIVDVICEEVLFYFEKHKNNK